MRTGRFQAPISIVARLALALLIFTATTSSLLAQAKRDVASEQQRIDALTREITIALAAASNAVDRSARKVSLLQALASLDALALESAETAGAFDVQALLQETASAVLADPSDASFEGARDDLTILRTIVNRIGDPVVRLPNLIEIAKLELRNGQTTSSKGTLLKSSDLVTRMDPGDVQDRFLAGLIRAAMPIESLELMILAEWIPRVGDATLRSTAARAFALYLLSHNRVNNEVRQSIGIRDIARRDQRLAELAQGYASTRRFRNALLSALTIEVAGL
ncbi:MAG: hypothetical protein ACRED5_20370, partial [Propylenella sp.]